MANLIQFIVKKKRWAIASILAALSLVWGVSGCAGLPPNSLVDANDVTIRLDAINEVLSNNNLSESEKRQALQDLGIQDDGVIDALIVGGPSQSQ